MKKGKVYLVGAGPGDMGLMTIRAKELVENAEVLIYDNLVNDQIIVSLSSPQCERIYVGKSGSSHTLEQDEINKLIADKAREDKMVVRLKGGDPFIFGRGGEEALHLADEGIAFEIVNGISSAYAVPAYAGIPVTNRGYSSSVAFITGHEDPTKMDSDIHWDRISTGIQTLVFLMGVKNLPYIIKKLTENGLDENTPAAVIQNGCQPIQRTVTGTLADITEKTAQANIRPPSIIVVGDVISLRDRINWYESKPLYGKTIVVTRSREQASSLVMKLTELGAHVIEMPVIKIVPPESTGSIDRSLDSLGSYNWIIFTSVNGVLYFFKYLFGRGLDSRHLSGKKICAIGTATAESLLSYGIKADLVPKKFVSDEISAELKAAGEITGKAFLLPRADIAPEKLSDILKENGASLVDDIAIYRTVEEEMSEKAADLFKKYTIDLVTFTSSSTVENFNRLVNNAGFSTEGPLSCAAIGPVTAAKADELGYQVTIQADTHTIDGLVEAIVDHFGKGR